MFLIILAFFNSLTSAADAAPQPLLVRPFITFPFSDVKFDASVDDEKDEESSNSTVESSGSQTPSDPAVIQYNPNVGADLGLMLQVAGFGLSVSVPSNTGKEADDKYGKTSYRDVKVDYFRQRFGAELGFQRYRGFHRNENVVAPTRSASSRSTSSSSSAEPTLETVIHKRSDLRKDGEYLNLHVIPFAVDRPLYASNRFAMEFSKHWGPVSWSPIFSLSIDRIALSADTPLIPSGSLSLFGDDAGLTSAQFTSVNGLGGILTDYRTSGGWGIAVGLSLGLGQQIRRLTIDNRTTRGADISTKLSFRMGVEKQIREWTGGFDLMVDGSTYKLSQSQIQSDVGYFMFYLAYALDLKSMDKPSILTANR